jgi:hypothetical protein
MNKIIFPLLLIIFTFDTTLSIDKAKGFFISFGVGPRFPVSSFASSTDLGYGLNVEFSYTDNEIIPFFIFAKVGYEQYPGSQEYYASTDYSNFSTTNVPINLGIRHYFSPLLESAFLLIPVVEASASFSYIKELHEFKLTSGKSNYYDEKYNFGFSAGLGVSMFLMEILASYNYFENNQFISADLKLRLPLLVIF